MTLRPTTAAEALKQSKSGFIKHIYKTDYYFSFDKEKLVWLETKPELSLWNTTLQSSLFFEGKEWLPYDPEPVDAELLEAQKLVGQWVRIDDNAYLVKQVYREECHPHNKDKLIIASDGNFYFYPINKVAPVWVSEPRCCLTDAPNKSGPCLISFGSAALDCVNYYNPTNQWHLSTERFYPIKGDVWYALPPQGGK